MIECGICKTRHEPVFRNSTQGYGCASEVLGDTVTGHFGSAVADMTSYLIVGKPIPNETIICDECMKSLIDAGEIREIPNPSSGGGSLPLDDGLLEELARSAGD